MAADWQPAAPRGNHITIFIGGRDVQPDAIVQHAVMLLLFSIQYTAIVSIPCEEKVKCKY